MSAKAFDEAASERLGRACRAGDEEGVRAALRDGADPEWNGVSKDWPMGGELPLPLHVAFRRGDVGIAEALLDAGASVEAGSWEGKPAAHWLGMSDGCALLWMERGGDPWKVVADAHGNAKAFAHIATRGGSAQVWDAIASRLPEGGDPNPASRLPFPDERGAVFDLAAKWHNLPAMEAIFKLGHRPDGPAMAQAAADLFWCEKHRLSRGRKFVKRLLELGAVPPSIEDCASHAYSVGRDRAEEAIAWMEATRQAIEELALRKAARGRGSKAPSKVRL